MQRWLFAPLLLTGVLVITGCATKNFVREEFRDRDAQLGRMDTDLGQARGRLDDLNGQVGDVRARAQDAQQRAERAGTLGTQALARADQAAGKAGEAAAKAGEAAAKAEETDKRLTRVWSNRNKLNVAETLVVHFRFAQAKLDDRAQTALLNAVKLLKEDGNVLVALAGYTDAAGQADYNLQLSQRRAEAVRRFLVQQGVDLHRIQSIGLGEAREPGTGRRARADSRRVVVQLMTPTE